MKNNHKKYVDQLRTPFKRHEAELRKKAKTNKKYDKKNDVLQEILDKKYNEFWSTAE